MCRNELVVSAFLVACFAASSSGVVAKELPSFIKICKRNDTRLSECVRDSVESLRPYLAAGIPELDVPPCEPLLIPKMVLHQGKGAVSVRSTCLNILVWGVTNFHLKYIKVDMQLNHIRIKVLVPHVYLTADYELSGRILMLPIVGSGICYSNYTNVDVACQLDVQTVRGRDGENYYQVSDVHLRLVIGGATLHFSDLFDGDKKLGDAMNSFLNENFKIVTDELRPILEETIGDTVKKMCNTIFSSKSIDVLLPE